MNHLVAETFGGKKPHFANIRLRRCLKALTALKLPDRQKQPIPRFDRLKTARSSRSRTQSIWLMGLLLVPLAVGAQLEDGPAYSPGGIQGHFGVDGTGAATYRIPIQVPPGTAGMEPQLMLDFHSRRGNGIVGVGWSISGIPTISRCAPTQAQDGEVSGLSYDYGDRFCFGGKRLMAVRDASGDLTTEAARKKAYGKDKTIYSTEIDSWTKVVSLGVAGKGPSTFEVTTGDGTRMWFGDAGLSANSAVKTGIPSNQNTVRIWALAKAEDLAGNSLIVDWDQDSGRLYPTSIQYTANASQNFKAQRKVQLTYEPRPDVLLQFQAGSTILTSKRLSNIVTSLDDNDVKTYQLAYAQGLGSERSLLTSVTEIGSDGRTKLHPTRFLWSGQAANPWGSTVNAFNKASLSGSADWSPVSSSDTVLFQPTDIDGNGLTDLVTVANSGDVNGYLSAVQGNQLVLSQKKLELADGYPTGSQALVADFTGNGAADLLHVLPDASTWSFYAGSNGFFAQSPAKLTIGSSCYNAANQQGAGFMASDVDGDGRSDVMITQFGQSDQVYILLATSGPNLSCAPNPLSAPSGSLSSSDTLVLSGRFSSDPWTNLLLLTNNDADEPSVTPQILQPRLASSSFQAVQAFSGEIDHWGNQKVIGDINGDGLVDMLAANLDDDPGFVPYAFLTKGDGTVHKPESLDIKPSLSSTARRFSGDFNGDGQLDYLVLDPINEQANQICASKGNATFRCGNLKAFPEFSSSSARTLFGDFNGDARIDIFFLSNASDPSIYLSAFVPEELIGVQEGQGKKIAVSYQPITTSVYQKGSVKPAYPIFHSSPASIRVVSRHSLDDGNHHTSQFSHRYSGSLADRSGRGWLGFTSVERAAESNHTVTTTLYHTDWPKSHHPKSKVVTCGAGNPDTQCKEGAKLRQFRWIWSDRHGGSSGQFAQVRQVLPLTMDKDRFHYNNPNGTTETTNTYDPYGNLLTRSLVDNANPGSHLNVAYTYSVDTDHHILHRPASMKVTNASNTLLRWQEWTYWPYVVPSETSTAARHGEIKSTEGQHGQVHEHIIHTRGDGKKPLISSFQYDGFGNRTHATVPPKGEVITEYDGTYHTFPVTITEPKTSSYPVALKTIHSFDARFGIQTDSTNYSRRQARLSFDAFGRLSGTFETSPDGRLVQVSRLSRSLDASGLLVFTAETARDWQADKWSQHETTLDGFGRRIRLRSTADDSTALHPKWIVEDRQYDESGHLRSVSLPYFDGGHAAGSTTYGYDAYSRLNRIQHADGRVDEVTFLLGGEKKIQLSAQAPATSCTACEGDTVQQTVCSEHFAGRSKITRKIFGSGYALDYERDAFGRLVAAKHLLGTVDCSGKATGEPLLSYTYDLAGRKLQRVTPAESQIWTWSDDGSLKGQDLYSPADHTHPLATSSFTYDSMARRTGATYQANDASEQFTYHYDTQPSEWTAPAGCGDLVGRPTAVIGKVDSAGSVPKYGYTYQYCYSPVGRLVKRSASITSGSATVSEAWTAEHAPSGAWLSFSYDDGRSVSRVLTPALGTASVTLKQGAAPVASGSWSDFDAYGQPQKHSFHNGLTMTSAYVPTSGLPSSAEILNGSQQSMMSLDYSYDKLDRLCELKESGEESSSYCYDSLGELKSVTSSSGSMTAGGQDPTSTTTATATAATVNLAYSADQDLQSVGNRSFELAEHEQLSSFTDSGHTPCERAGVAYDSSGNLKSLDFSGNGCTSYQTSFSYDARMRLASYTDTRKTGSSSFGYDHTGRRIFRTDRDGTTTFYLGSGRQWLMPKATPDSQTDPRTLELPTPYGQRLTHTSGQPSGTHAGVPKPGPAYLFLDRQGSTRMVADGSGALTAKISYSPFGRFTLDSGKDDFRSKFTGKEYDADTGLYYFNSRYYSPELARFTTPDTRLGATGLTDFDAFKLYAYTGNDPINRIDPSGHDFLHVLSVVGSFAIDTAEVAGGVALFVLTDGACEICASTLISAGISGFGYSATHTGKNFSWKGFGIAQGIGAAAGLVGGVAGAEAGDAASVAAETAGASESTAATVGAITGSTVGSMAADATTQGINIALGRQDHFNWAELGIAAAQGFALGVGAQGLMQGADRFSFEPSNNAAWSDYVSDVRALDEPALANRDYLANLARQSDIEETTIAWAEEYGLTEEEIFPHRQQLQSLNEEYRSFESTSKDIQERLEQNSFSRYESALDRVGRYRTNFKFVGGKTLGFIASSIKNEIQCGQLFCPSKK